MSKKVVVTDRDGENGRCSNCNQSASLKDVQHACGAILTQAAIDANSPGTRLTYPIIAGYITDHSNKVGKEFVGVGKILKVPGKDEFYYRRDFMASQLPDK